MDECLEKTPIFFFFFKQKTAYEIRPRDWSSDVCSSDLEHGGMKTNVIPDTVDLQVDIRTLPGYSGDDVRAQLKEALGDLADKVEIAADSNNPSTESPMDTQLWDVLRKGTRALVPASDTVPFLIVGATDARFMRKIGTTSYGYGLLSPKIPFNEFAGMFHGDNERVDQESLRLSTELWKAATIPDRLV